MRKRREESIQSKIRILKERHVCWLSEKKEHTTSSRNSHEVDELFVAKKRDTNKKLDTREVIQTQETFREGNEEFLNKLSKEIASRIRNDLQSHIANKNILHNNKSREPQQIFAVENEKENTHIYTDNSFMLERESSQMKEKFLIEYHYVAVRHKILSNECTKLKEKDEAMMERQNGIVSMITMLKEEKEKVLESISSLQEQLSLVDTNIAAQMGKGQQMKEESIEVRDQIQIIKKTLATMELDMEKTRALGGAVGADPDDFD